MTTVDDTRIRPPLRLYYRTTFVEHRDGGFGDLIQAIRDKQSRALAYDIVKRPDFFSTTMSGGYGTIQADVIVMSEQEYADKMRDQFMKGVDHANSFRSVNWMG